MPWAAVPCSAAGPEKGLSCHRRLPGNQGWASWDSWLTQVHLCSQTLPIYAILKRTSWAWSNTLRSIQRSHLRGYHISNQISVVSLYKLGILLLFRALLPKLNHSFSFPSKISLTTGAKWVPEAGKLEWVPMVTEPISLFHVIGSTAPCAELFVPKTWQCVAWQRPCPPAKAAGEKGNGKGDGEHMGSSNSDSTAQSVARAAEATKPCSKSYIYSLFPLPKQMPCEMPSKAAVWESCTFSSTPETANVPYAVTWHF